jgi:hemoglobin-like flavoprotein
MVNEMSYSTISCVIENWEDLRQTKDYEVVAGGILFQRLFTKCPQAKVVFGFPLDADPTSTELTQSKRFKMHSSYFIQMIDTALGMLGPDIELLTEIMLELGQKHVRYGVKPEMFPIMGEVLIVTLQQVLPKHKMNDVHVAAWKEVYHELSADMIRAMVTHTLIV